LIRRRGGNLPPVAPGAKHNKQPILQKVGLFPKNKKHA
jgi:hypothetical protein